MPIDAETLKGYASPDYARSLTEFGEPILLPRSGGHLLRRPIPGTPYFDAMGCYPLFFCRDWDGLAEDLAALSGDIVSVVFVADPFGVYTPDLLERGLDLVRPFKQHFIVDLGRDPDAIGTAHHRKAARRALRRLQVEVCRDPAGFVDDWSRLYGTLMRRHGVEDIRAFSRTAFARQLAMPETVVHQAFLGSELVGAQLFYVQDKVVHCHLGAVSDAGYKAGAFYALDFFSFDYFAGMAERLDLGGGAGLALDAGDGLSRYKRGWAADTRRVYLCGHITNPGRYAALARDEKTDYFPAYRSGEFDRSGRGAAGPGLSGGGR